MGNNPEAALWIFANQTSINVMGHKMNDVQYSLIHKTNVFTIYISTYLHIYPHILYLFIVVLANFNLLSRPFIMLPPGRQLASGRGAVAAMQCIMQI